MDKLASRLAERWYALQVRLRHEEVVAAGLTAKGFESFLPCYASRRRRSDRIATIKIPLFAGYVFCRFDPADRAVPVVTTRGIVRVLSFGGKPEPIPDTTIESLKISAVSELPMEPWPYMASGTPVRIREGVLAGVEGTLMDVKKRDRIVVSVHLLQRSVAIEIDSCSVTTPSPNRMPAGWEDLSREECGVA